MARIFMAVAFTLAMSVVALSQTQNKPTALGRAEQELTALSQKAVDDCIGKEIFVLEDAAPKTPFGVPGKATARGEYDAVELVDAKTSVDGELAVITGRVLFKGGLPDWQSKESSHSVTISFSRRNGQWEFIGLCLGECSPE